jgi:hypothetical protein
VNIKLDENLPDRLVSVLTGLRHDVDTVYVERMNGRVDADVWTGTQTAKRFFITQDLDFSDMRRYAPARTPACSWSALRPTSFAVGDDSIGRGKDRMEEDDRPTVTLLVNWAPGNSSTESTKFVRFTTARGGNLRALSTR